MLLFLSAEIFQIPIFLSEQEARQTVTGASAEGGGKCFIWYFRKGHKKYFIIGLVTTHCKCIMEIPRSKQ